MNEIGCNSVQPYIISWTNSLNTTITPCRPNARISLGCDCASQHLLAYDAGPLLSIQARLPERCLHPLPPIRIIAAHHHPRLAGAFARVDLLGALLLLCGTTSCDEEEACRLVWLGAGSALGRWAIVVKGALCGIGGLVSAGQTDTGGDRLPGVVF